jgi:hypothetical protein
MTFGGGVAGIGLDGSGLGEGGILVISAHKCNDQRDDQSEDLDRQEDDRAPDAFRCGFEDDLLCL